VIADAEYTKSTARLNNDEDFTKDLPWIKRYLWRAEMYNHAFNVD